MLGELRNDGFIDPETLNDSLARMWQMYLGIVGVNCGAWVQFTTECSFSLDELKDPLKSLYYFQCVLEGKSKNVPVVLSVFELNTIQFIGRTLLPYHIALLCAYLSKSTKQLKYYI